MSLRGGPLVEWASVLLACIETQPDEAISLYPEDISIVM